MKKIVTLILCAGLLCSCADKKENSVSLAPVENSVTECITEAVTDKTTEAETETTTEVKTEAPTEEYGKLFCIYSKTGLTLKMDGVEKNFVELQHIPNAEQNVIADFNFDGYEDIFIPLLELDELGRYGNYWLFSPEKDLFYISQELAVADGVGYIMDIYQHNQLEMVEFNLYGKEVRFYEWQGDKLVPMYFNDYYYASSDDIIDRYEFDDNGEKILVSRTFVNPSNGAQYKTVENPIYFRVTDTTVDVMQGENIIQQLDNHNLPQLYNELVDYVENYTAPADTPISGGPQFLEIEKYLITKDFDFDGHNDLAIPTDFSCLNGKNTYVYYRYDPQTEQFVRWEELENKGHTLYMFSDRFSDDKYIYAFAGSYKDDESYYFEYRWFGDELKLTEKHIYYGNSNNAEVITYDENGNEISRRTSTYIRDDFTQ